MFHVVIIDPPDDAYLETEDEAIAWIKSHMPRAAFAPWREKTMRAYRDERSRDLAEARGGTEAVRCAAFIVDTSESKPPPAEP